MDSRDSIEAERRRRKLRIESGAETVIRHWLTGEVLEEKPIELQHRRSYRKTGRTRNLATKERPRSGQVGQTSLL